VTFPNIHILYPSLVHPLHYSPSSRIPLLDMTLTCFNVPYSYMYRKCLNIFTLLHLLHLLSPLTATPSPERDPYIPVLHCSSVCSLFSGVLPCYFTIFYFNQSNPHYYSSLSFFFGPVLFNSFQ
jgi:hypothetical protein